MSKELEREAEEYMLDHFGGGYSPDKNFCMHFGPNDMKAAFSKGATSPYVEKLIAEARAEAFEEAAKECPPGEWGLNMCRHFMERAARARSEGGGDRPSPTREDHEPKP